jgi:hypothetical protein
MRRYIRAPAQNDTWCINNLFVAPAKAESRASDGTSALDSRLRGNDGIRLWSSLMHFGPGSETTSRGAWNYEFRRKSKRRLHRRALNAHQHSPLALIRAVKTLAALFGEAEAPDSVSRRIARDHRRSRRRGMNKQPGPPFQSGSDLGNTPAARNSTHEFAMELAGFVSRVGRRHRRVSCPTE